MIEVIAISNPMERKTGQMRKNKTYPLITIKVIIEEKMRHFTTSTIPIAEKIGNSSTFSRYFPTINIITCWKIASVFTSTSSLIVITNPAQHAPIHLTHSQ